MIHTRSSFALALVDGGLDGTSALHLSNTVFQLAEDNGGDSSKGSINPANLQAFLAFILQILPLILPLFIHG